MTEKMKRARRKPQRKRTVRYHFTATKEEDVLIRERMASIGVVSLGAYMRKVAIDGYIINLDLSDVRELVTLLRRCSNNLNQYAKRANETGSVYAADVEDLRVRFDGLWDAVSGILSALSGLK